jgi:hypothetical protein
MGWGYGSYLGGFGFRVSATHLGCGVMAESAFRPCFLHCERALHFFFLWTFGHLEQHLRYILAVWFGCA